MTVETAAHKALEKMRAERVNYSWALELQDPRSPVIDASGHVSWFDPSLEPHAAGAYIAASILDGACFGEFPLLTVAATETLEDSRLVESGRDLFRAGVLPVPAESFCIDADLDSGSTKGDVDRVLVCAEHLREKVDGDERARLVLTGFFGSSADGTCERVWDATPGIAALVEENAHHSVYENDLVSDEDVRDINIRQNALVRIALATLALMTSPDSERAEVSAPANLNKRRTAKGRPPIPARTTVRVNPDRVRAVAEAAGGSHAAPRPHFRRGHPRTLPDGRVVAVGPTVVGVAPEERERMKSEIPASVYDVRRP